MTEINYVRNLSGACLTVVRGAPQLGLPIPPRRKQWEFCTTRSLLAACRRRVEPSCSAIPPRLVPPPATGIVMCPGYCRECLRPDWRFGMSGQRKYSMELRERATRMALEARADPGRRRGAIKRISGQLGINPEALRTWVRAVEQGGRNERGEISEQEAHIRALEAENRELRRANEILKAASTFFGAELDRLGR